MRKWKCVHVEDVNKNTFTYGKIYESDDRGYNIIGDKGYCFTELSADEGELGFVSTKFEEVFEEKEENKMKFKVGDKVKVLDGNYIKGYSGGWSGYMARNIGKTATISKCLNNGYKLNDSHFNWSNCIYDGRGLRLVLESNKTITIDISDTITTLTDGTHTTTVKRYIDDKHNERNAVGYVVDKYFDELKEIERVSKLPKVGDKVKVVDKWKVYSDYSDWLLENKVELRHAIKWKSGDVPSDVDCYTVVKINPHKDYEMYGNIALIDGVYGTFMIALEGLEVVK